MISKLKLLANHLIWSDLLRRELSLLVSLYHLRQFLQAAFVLCMAYNLEKKDHLSRLRSKQQDPLTY